jgi:hypothetical protein
MESEIQSRLPNLPPSPPSKHECRKVLLASTLLARLLA